jgi:hypothetical protein
MKKKVRNPVFEQYYRRLMWEGIIKSLICGFIIGFAVNFISAFVFWAFDIQNFWLAIVIGVAVGALATAGFYYTKFKPDTVKIARRVDRMGLEERLITMTELEHDESYIALKQREDAKLKLSTVNAKSIRFKVSTAIIVACAVTFALSSSMTVVAGLSESGFIKKGSDIIDIVLPEKPVELIELIYDVQNNDGGYIEGEPIQIIEKGQSGTTVIAVPDDGYAFTGWSDGYKNPTRTDRDVVDNKTVEAIFIMLGDSEEGGEGMGLPLDIEPPPDAKPNENGKAPEKETDQHFPQAGEKWEETNMIIDGQTFYRDVYDEYYREAMEKLAANPDLSPELRKVIETYMGILLS